MVAYAWHSFPWSGPSRSLTAPARADYCLMLADCAAVGINGNGIGEPQDFRFAPNAHG